MEWEKIAKAFESVKNGEAKRIDVSDTVIVYRAGNVIRIDVKGVDG